MKQETLVALKYSIAVWEVNVTLAKENWSYPRGPGCCPLCQVFRKEKSSNDETEICSRQLYDNFVEKCPVAEKAGCTNCENTPWQFTDNCMEEPTQAMLDYLTSLLPS